MSVLLFVFTTGTNTRASAGGRGEIFTPPPLSSHTKMKSKAMVKSSGEMHKKWLLVLVIFDALENLLSLMILYDQ